ncbi:MAG: tail fiber assembly protein [Bacteroidota bacterium]|jgi:hypothetical protein
MHALIENDAVKQYPYSIEQLKRANPNVSFPKNASDTLLSSFGMQRVFFSTQPELTNTQVLEESAPVFSAEDQRWTQVWTVRDMTTEEIASRDESQAASVRAERDRLLVQSDWTQGKDIPDNVSGPWAVYRQSLRDITAQSGFPWTVEWPVAP